MPFEQNATASSPAVALLKQRLSKFETEEGRLKGLSYQPRPNDVAISNTPKAGTTWMQQICHQIRSADAGGDMDFDEISRVVPWVELAVDQGQDLEAPQYGEKEGKPRIFKTHLWYDHCPKFQKTIVVLRNPFDVVASFYKFFEGWFFEAGSIDLDTFAEEFWLARGVPQSRMQNASYFEHLTSWYKRRHEKESVLIIFFEDLKEDLTGQVKKVARFLSTTQHDFDKAEIIQLATERSTFDFMKAHENHFDEKLSKLARNEACGLPKNAGMQGGKIVNGKTGSGSVLLSAELRAKIDKKWREVVDPVTKCATYEDLRKQLNGTES
jgi:hypothetical protein